MALFPIHHQTEFSLNVYGQKVQKHSISIDAIMNLFHPKTIDETFNENSNGLVEGIKDSNGNWNIKGHKDRLIHLDATALATIGRVFDTNPTAPVLPNIHCESLLHILKKFGTVKCRIKDIEELTISSMWNETTSRVDGTIREFPKLGTKRPASFEKLILNGPHLNVGSPLFKTPRNPCKHNLDWSIIDLEAIPDDFVPRAKYEQACDQETYDARQVKCEWDKVINVVSGENGNVEVEQHAPFDRHWRIAYREMVGTDSERTLTSAVYPLGISWINTVNGIAAKDLRNVITIAANFASLPMDAGVRQLGKGHLLPALINGLPYIEYRETTESAFLRIIALNSLTESYSDLWTHFFNSKWIDDQWTQNHAGLDSNWCKQLTSIWQHSSALRSDLSRRQALLEIDVLTAHAMGFTLDELKTLYRMRFRVMRDYEQNTWYDQKGRIVFTTNAGLSGVGLPNKSRPKDAAEGITFAVNGKSCSEKGLGFEDVKDMKDGCVSKTFPDDSMTADGTPEMRTVTYYAPFFKMDREKDYETAWRVFGERFGWTDVPGAPETGHNNEE